MTGRPRRYPYTRSQWVTEEIIMSYDTGCFKLRVEKNEVTQETR